MGGSLYGDRGGPALIPMMLLRVHPAACRPAKAQATQTPENSGPRAIPTRRHPGSDLEITGGHMQIIPPRLL